MAKIYIKVVPQIYKDLLNTLFNCQGIFEANVPKSTLFIADVTAFNFDIEGSEALYRIQILTNNNTKDIFIARDNVHEFTLHFK